MTIRFELRTTKKTAEGERVPLHISVSDGRDFRKRQVTKILIDPTRWDLKAADLKKRVLIPEDDRQSISKEMSAIRSYISEAYAIDKEKGKVNSVWLEKTVENYYKGKSLAPKARKSRKKNSTTCSICFPTGENCPIPVCAITMSCSA